MMTKFNCRIISLLTLLLFAQLTAASSSQLYIMKLDEHCQKLIRSPNCACSKNSFEIKCPKDLLVPKISISIGQNNRVHIKCQHLIPNEFYRLLPKMTIGSKPIVQISQCPLTQGLTVKHIFQKLGITQVNELLLESKELGGYLERTHFEGLQDLGRLQLSSNSHKNLPENLFAELKNLTSLNLRWNTSQKNRNHRARRHLSSGIFRNQKKLNQLNLSSNNFLDLTKETFEGVSSLTELRLSLNNIVTIHPDVFSLLTNIVTVNLTGNYFKSLPDNLFAANRNLSSFHLYDNRVPLKQIPATLLGHLPNLREVRLTCSLEKIPELLFVKSTGIRNITISGNNLTELPLMLFAGQFELTNLDLCRNQLMSLPDEMFMYARNLRVLRLSQNRLVSISEKIFLGLSSLQMLYVDNNNIFTIHPKAFAYTPKLACINMENNQIKLYDSFHSEHNPTDQIDIDSPFKGLKELQTLNLKNNSIQTIFVDWRDQIPKLRTLDLSYNKFTKISHYELKYQSYDIFVNLSHNFIQKINFDDIDDWDFRNSTKKIKMDLSNNLIDCDCELLAFVKFLKQQIEGRRNEIIAAAYELQCSYPENIKYRLVNWLVPEELICPLDNEINAPRLCPLGCSCWERPADKIAIVNCSNAKLTEMPMLPNLKQTRPGIHGIELHIENNRLIKLPNANSLGYMHVVRLYASNNSLTEVLDNNLPKNLSSLNLSYNKMQHLNDTVLIALNKSRIISALAGNPWKCDCAAKGLLRFVQYNYEIISDIKRLECVDGQKFQDLSVNIICPANHTLFIALCVLIAVVGLCASIIAPLYYKYQHEIKVWLYTHDMCLCFVSEEELDKDKKYDAFISFSHKDEDFIMDYLLPELESGPTPFKLCLHSRDWVIGEFIPYQIIQSVDDSRRTIVVISPSFIESIWARMEFRAAHTAALNEGRIRVIAIIYGDIGNIDSLDDELQTYLRMNTYIKWGDPWFWKKLRYAMTHLPKNISAQKNSMDDKLEQIKPPRKSPNESTNRCNKLTRNGFLHRFQR